MPNEKDYWQNEAKELRDEIEELKKRVDGINDRDILVMKRIDDLKDFNKNRFDSIDKML